ncbi:MAG: hypothetical protein ACLFVQ_05720 [Chitinispirillaceae bacterium]
MDRRYSALILFLSLLVPGVGAQSVSVNRDSITVGDTFNLNVTLTVPSESDVISPDIEKDFGDLVVRDMNSGRKEGSKEDTLTYNYIMTTYEPQNCTIPKLPFITGADSTSDTLLTQAVPIHVLSVLPSDSNVTLKDLKAQQRAGKAPLWWLWIVAAVTLAGLILLAKRLLTKTKAKVLPVIPPKPPYEEAVEALEKLKKRNLIQHGYIQEYVFELSEIFKRYLGRRYEVNASEFTTEEMIDWLDTATMAKELKMNAEWFFRTSDPVKFAKWIPEMQIINRFLKEVEAFLEATKPVPASAENEQKETATTQKTENKA